MDSVKIIAPPKVNLFLHVTGKRSDGYHLLDSLVAFPSSLGDVLTLEKSDRFSFAVRGPFSENAGPDADNLVVRAYKIFPEEVRPPLKISLEKNMPAGAGIGGGSSDAAATIRGLEQISGHVLQPEQRHKILLSLGADVPACYVARPLRMQEIGDVVTPAAPLPKAHIVLCWPGVPSFTKDVFGAWDQNFLAALPSIPPFKTIADLVLFLQSTCNSLSDAAQKTCPPIMAALSAMSQQEGCLLSRMSGSGSCVFGLFENGSAAEDAAHILSKQNPAWWVRSSLL